MRKTLTAALAAAVLGIVFASREAAAVRQELPVAGGYSRAAADDPEVLEAARFAVEQAGRRQGRRLSLVAVRSAERQVVAGLNYRLRLGVRDRGEEREASAVVYRNLKNVYSLTSWEWSGGAGAAGPTREVKVYLVALDDRGRRGRKIGCDDSLVPVTRTVRAGGDPLRAAVEALLAEPRESEGGLGNYWWGENLKVTSVSARGGTATIRLSGNVYVAGVCDVPRIEEQIRETARQFPGVRRVRVFVGGRPLSQVIR